MILAGNFCSHNLSMLHNAKIFQLHTLPLQFLKSEYANLSFQFFVFIYSEYLHLELGKYVLHLSDTVHSEQVLILLLPLWKFQQAQFHHLITSLDFTLLLQFHSVCLAK